MCKIMIIPNVSKLSVKRLREFIEHMAPEMSAWDKDGFGYAYQGEQGIFSEKFLDPQAVLAMRPAYSPPSFLVADSESQGELSKPIGGLLLHSRTSTNVRGLKATHPFREQGLALIHNGVTQNVGEKVHYSSGNDSEMLFKHYLNGGMDRVAKSVSGYYAVGILDENKRQTIIFKDATARLSAMYSKKLGSLVFATTADILDAACEFLKEECRIFKVKNNVHLRFNASGILLEETSFKPIEKSFGELDKKSLGFSPASKGNPGKGSLEDAWSYPEDDFLPVDDELTLCDGYGRPISAATYAKLSKDEQDACTFWNDSLPVTAIRA